jgi:hypothetical protein
VLAGLLLFPLFEATRVLRGYREATAEAPDVLTAMSFGLSMVSREPESTCDAHRPLRLLSRRRRVRRSSCDRGG